MSVRLPMEIWSHIAKYIPFPYLIDTFWALRRAALLPLTYTTPSNALIQFCSEHTISSDDEELVHHEREAITQRLLEMGFDRASIDSALCEYDGDIHSILNHFLYDLRSTD